MKRIYVPLFWKFTLAIIGVVALFGSINALLIRRNVYSSLQQESQKRGLYIARSIAEEAVEPYLYEDFIAMQKLVDAVRRIDATVEYVFIVDGDGRVLVHSFPETVPQELVAANRLAPGDSLSVRLIRPVEEPERLIRDIAVPLESLPATVRVGIEEHRILAQVMHTLRTLLTMVGVFLVVGIVGALVFALFITRPIRAISRVADRLNLDALKARSQPRIRVREKFLGRLPMLFRARDELDDLADRFNGMIDRLEDAYEELEAAYTKLVQSEKLASVGTLAAGIAHEINNPIAGMQNCLHRLSRDPGNVEQNRRYLELMQEATEKIERVVQGLLDYTRQDALAFEWTDVAEVVEKAVVLVTYQLEKSCITVTRDIPENLPPIWASAGHLQQVLVNLLLNSIDAIVERSEQDPTCDCRIVIRAAVGSVPEGDGEEMLELMVEDSGIGIDEENLPKVFDPFFTTKEIGKGTGLGLAVCYKIVQSHGGDIQIKSRVNQGTCITVKLPILVKDHATVEDIRGGR